MENYNKIHKNREIAEKHLDKIKLRGGKGTITQISKNEFVVNYSFEQTKRKEIYNFFNTQFDVSKAYKLLQSGTIMFDIKDIPTYEMKHSAFDKEYSELMEIDFNRAQGLMVKHNGKDLLIDGSHRLNNAYKQGIKTMKVFYIENPKTIKKFSKNV